MDLVLIKDQHSNLKSEISYLVVPSLLMKCPQIKKKTKTTIQIHLNPAIQSDNYERMATVKAIVDSL